MYTKLWGYSVTSICYRLGQLGCDSVSAHRALETLIGCEIRLGTVQTGISDGDNPKYEQGRAAPLTVEQLATLTSAGAQIEADLTLFPDEVIGSVKFIEGACRTITVNAYERDPEVRKQCIAAHGTDCAVCEMSFAEEYGSDFEGFIHIHHLRPLSEVGSAHEIDPVADLRPVCPNCHAVVHRRKPAFSIEEVRAFWKQKHP